MKRIFLLVTIICASSAGCQHADSKARFLVEANNFLNYPLGSYSYIDRNGKTAIPGEFCYAGKFHEGIALAMRDCSKLKAEREWRDVSLEFIRNDGKVVLEVKGDLLKEITFSYLSDGLISIKRGQFCGYVDQQGKTVIDFIYEYCPPFESGFAYVGKGNKYYLLNKFGEIVNLSPAGYDHFWGCASNICLFSFKAGSKSQSYVYRFFDTGKKRFIGNEYQNARPFSSGLAAVQQRG